MPKTDIEPTRLEKTIDQALIHLEDVSPASDEYSAIVDQITKLHAMTPTKEPWVKPEILIGVLGNLAGILAIVNYEHVHVLSSKAVSFVMKSAI